MPKNPTRRLSYRRRDFTLAEQTTIVLALTAIALLVAAFLWITVTR